MKCYGRKATTVAETSLTRNFFGGIFSKPMSESDESQSNDLKNNQIPCQNESATISGSKDSIVNKSESPSLFGTFLDEPVKPVEPLKSCKKASPKVQRNFLKQKKYKGRRRIEKNDIPQCTKLEDEFEAQQAKFDTIDKHDLIVEHHLTKDVGLDFVDLKYASNRDNSQIILESSHSTSTLHFFHYKSEIEKKKDLLPAKDNKELNPKAAVNVQCKLSPIAVKGTKLNVSISPCLNFESPELQRNKMGSSAQICLTSTPVSSKEFCTKFINISNLSAGATSKNLKLTAHETSVKQLNKCMQQKLHVSCNKSYSDIERSAYVKSHSGLKEVFAEDIWQPSILPKLLELCNQAEILSFMDIYDWKNTVFTKAGEGSYGEVFMLTRNKKSFIIKVIPVSENSEDDLQSMESVYSEIKVSRCLSQLRFNSDYRTKNFMLLKKVHVVQGTYPEEMLQAWDIYSEAKSTYNHRPDTFQAEQIFVILELEYGGKDMSSFVLLNGAEAESVFKQIAISLAIAEETHLFEHRDLHLGNILIQRIRAKKISYKFRGKTISIASEGLLVTIIDFTLSRISDDGCIYYNDMAEDESLFNQSGDYQFEVYRATKLLLENKWNKCLLYSNVLWLNFVCVKLQEHTYSHSTTMKHKRGLKNIKMFADKLKLCKSASDCLKICEIVTSIPEKIELYESKLNSETQFIDKKSFQKSYLFNKM